MMFDLATLFKNKIFSTFFKDDFEILKNLSINTNIYLRFLFDINSVVNLFYLIIIIYIPN